MPISGGCPKPFFVQPWSHDLWSRPISISRLTRHFFPSTTRWGNSSDSPDPPEIACAMSAAVGNRSFGSNDMALVTTSESSWGTLGSRSRGDRKSSDLPAASCFIEAWGSLAVRRKKRTAPTLYRSLAGVLPQVLLRGPPTRCVDDGSGPGELVELLLRRPEVEEDDLSAGVEDDVLGLHIPVDHVPRVKVRQRLEELEDVSSGRRRVGRLVLVQLRQRLALELFLDEAERSEVGAFVHISDDPWMTRGLEGPQDLGFDPKPFLGLGKIEAAGLFHDDGLTAVGLAEINGRHPSFRHLADDFVAALPTFQGAGKGEGHTVRRPYLTTNCSVTSSATSISSSFWSSVRPVPVTRMREAPRTNHVLFVLCFRCTMVVPSSTKNRSPSWKTVRCPREISFACFGLGRNFAKSVRPINHWDGGIGCSVLSGKTR